MNPIGMFSWFGYALSLSARIEMIANAGFSSTSLWLGKLEEHVRSGNSDEMPALVTGTSLSIDSAHAPFEHCNCLWSPSREDRKTIRSELAACISYSGCHSIPALVIHITKSDSPPLWSDEGLDVLRDLVKLAEDSNTVIAVENTRKPDYLDFVLGNIESPFLGLCYDSSHDFLWGDPPVAILRKWGHRLAVTHFSDNNGENDDHWLPGEGAVDWNIVRESFPRRTYKGSISLEAVPVDTERISAVEFLAKAFKRAKELFPDLTPVA